MVTIARKTKNVLQFSSSEDILTLERDHLFYIFDVAPCDYFSAFLPFYDCIFMMLTKLNKKQLIVQYIVWCALVFLQSNIS